MSQRLQYSGNFHQPTLLAELARFLGDVDLVVQVERTSEVRHGDGVWSDSVTIVVPDHIDDKTLADIVAFHVPPAPEPPKPSPEEEAKAALAQAGSLEQVKQVLTDYFAALE